MKKDTSINGMNSQDASKVKLAGHACERKRIQHLKEKGIEAKILGGTIKPDIQRISDGLLESVKHATKTQWYLFTYRRVIESNLFTDEEKEVFKKWGTCFTTPNPHCSLMCEVIKKDPEKWIRFFIGTDKFDLLVMLDKRNGEWVELQVDEFISKIMKQITEIYFNGTKVVFKGGGSHLWPNNPRRKNGVVLFELDRRSSKKSSLFHSHLDRIIDCVK